MIALFLASAITAAPTDTGLARTLEAKDQALLDAYIGRVSAWREGIDFHRAHQLL